MADVQQQPRPYWLPDTQGFLAIAIISLMGIVVLILLNAAPKFDDKTAGVLMTVLGVLTACLKDVYSFFFGSSQSSKTKDDTQAKVAEKLADKVGPPQPTAPIAPTQEKP